MDQVAQLEHEHDFQLVELRKARTGLDRVLRCGCGAEAVELAQAAERDLRPPLGDAGT